MQKATTITNILMMTYDICDAVAVVVRIVAAVNPYRHDEPVSAKVWPDDASCSFSVVSHTSEQRYMPLLDAWVEVLSMAPGYEGPVLTVRARGDGTYYVWSGTVVCVMCPVAHGGSEGQSSLQNATGFTSRSENGYRSR